MENSSVPAKAIIVQTQEEERYRLARLLQAGPAQLLANASAEIEAYLRLADSQPQLARAGLGALLRELQQGLGDIRELIAGLQPALLQELGLVACLEKHVASFRQQTDFQVELAGWEQLTTRLPAIAELAIFRIIQEALQNVRQHARATRVLVKLECPANQMIVTIEDNGHGFVTSGGAPGRRLGLVMMQDRAELLGGNLQIFSTPGQGVRVVLTAPMRIHGLSEAKHES